MEKIRALRSYLHFSTHVNFEKSNVIYTLEIYLFLNIVWGRGTIIFSDLETLKVLFWVSFPVPLQQSENLAPLDQNSQLLAPTRQDIYSSHHFLVFLYPSGPLVQSTDSGYLSGMCDISVWGPWYKGQQGFLLSLLTFEVIRVNKDYTIGGERERWHSWSGKGLGLWSRSWSLKWFLPFSL